MASPFKDDREVKARQGQGTRSANETTAPGSGDADALFAAGRYEEALSSYRAASNRPGLSTGDQVRLRRRIAVTLEALARWEDARAALDEARDLAAAGGLLAEEAHVLIETGKVHMVRGEIEKALECAAVALQRSVESSDLLARGYAENLRGFALFRRGQLDDSAASFERALVAFKEAGNLRALSLVYNNLGNVHRGRCNWKQSLEYFQVATNLQAVEGEESERRKSLNNLGIVHLRLGHLPEARDCFEQSLAIGRRLGDVLSVIHSVLGLAETELHTGNYSASRDWLEQSLELCTQDTYPRETALTHRVLGSVHMAAGDLDRARRCYEIAWKKAVEVAPEGDLATDLLLLRAELALALGRAKEALSLAGRSLDLARKAGDTFTAAEVHRVLGNAARAIGDSDRAEVHFNDGVTALKAIDAPYPLALTLLDMSRLGVERIGTRVDSERIVKQLEEALRLFRMLGVQRYAGETLLTLARTHVRTGDFDRASSSLSEATEILRGVALPQALGWVADVQNELESRFVEESVSHLNEFRATSRIQEILDTRTDAMAKIGQIVEVIATAVEADGALLVSADFGDGSEPVAYRRMSPAVARAMSGLLANLSSPVTTRPMIVLNTAACSDTGLADLARRHSAASLILIPIAWGDGTALLYLDRTRNGRSGAFRQSNLNLSVVLSSYLVDLFKQYDRDERVQENMRLKMQLEERIALADVVTQNREMLQILRLVEKINRSNLTVLLQGETGTGKTLIAKAIHLSSPRSHGPFVTVDCAALPDNLLESELFGYLRGSFTGATADKKGLFEEADGGTIFLDEIGRAGLTVQRRLLHLLDKGEVRPIGSNAYRKLDVRVICATSSKDLKQDVAQGGFIKDLYYRLNDISIVVPSLRDRVEDIPLLADYFMATFLAETQRDLPGISNTAMNRLLQFNWPGNVRELEKAVRRACILCEDGQMIGPEHLPEEILQSREPVADAVPLAGGLHDTVEDMERKMVLKALEENDWNKSRAAVALGLSRKGLKNKITRYDLDRRSRS